MNILSKIKDFHIEDVNKLINVLEDTMDPELKMDIIGGILIILKINGINTNEFESELIDLVKIDG
jgi:hypothetical protein